ncbi:MAG: NAD/NADP octopine/nopaline dehydrogenase family protein [Burkholderiaceae bacterium]
MRIAILGGGHGCFAAAADLTEQGHAVSLWRRSAGQFGELADHCTLALTDTDGTRPVRIHRVTGELATAIGDAELIVVPTPAFAQENIASAMAPYLKSGQVVFLAPGSLGSIVMARAAAAAGSTADVMFAETGTLPYLARKHGATSVTITMRAVRLPTGVYPASKTDQAITLIQKAYPSVHPIEDALSGALMNAGPIIHPPLIIMNAGPLEHSDAFDIHNEGTQPAVRRVTDQLDAERIAIREALGYAPNHYPLKDHYDSDRWMYGDSHQRLVDSGDWREDINLLDHRYMTEDVAFGLSLLDSVGRYAGVATPIATGLLSISRAICNTGFLYGERSLELMGLAQLSEAQLTHLLQQGEANQ